MARKTEVSGSVVRTWANSEDGQAFMTAWAAEQDGREVPTVGARGKFSQTLIDLFHKANKGQKYVTKLVPTIKVKGVRVSDSGRKTPVQVTATLAEVRAFAEAEGLPVGARGRVSQDVLTAFASRPKV